MANEKNLKPFQPGESGNPAGGSRKTRLTTALIKLIDEKGLDERFVKVGMKAALKGDFFFWKYIFDRIDGPIKPEEDTTDGTLIELVEEAEKRAVDRSQGTSDEPAKPVL